MRYIGRLELVDDTSAPTVSDMLTATDREMLAVVFASARSRMRHRLASSRVTQLETLAVRLGVVLRTTIGENS